MVRFKGFPRPDADIVNLRFALISCLGFALAACGQHGTPANASQDAKVASAQAPKKHGLTAEDIARIKASGKTGIWSDTTEICGKHASRVTLTWNATGQADKVVVMMVGRKGNQRMFGGGASIGRKQTGKWVYPGMSFKLLDAANHTELGSVAFTGKQCG